MSFDTAYLKLLRERIEEQRQKSIDTVIGGHCADHSEYRYACGYLKALDDVKIIGDEIVSDIQKG